MVLLWEVSEQMKAPVEGMVCSMGFFSMRFLFCYGLGLTL